jgi:hypothetical protein
MNLKFEEEHVHQRMYVLNFTGVNMYIGQFDRKDNLWYPGRNSQFNIDHRKGFVEYNDCKDYIQSKIIEWIHGQIN